MRRCLLVVAGLVFFLVLLAHPVSAASLQGRTVVLDPGHGANTGARGVAGTVEDVNVLAIAVKARALLEADGARVVMTRTVNQVPTVSDLPNAGQLLARMTLANRSGADLFVSIHNDWNPSPAIRGITTYYMVSRGTAVLASIMQEALVAATGMRDVGTISREFFVLRHATMPAVLLEIGFLSNRQDEALLIRDDTRQRAARGIRNGILRYLGIDQLALPGAPGRDLPGTPSPGQPDRDGQRFADVSPSHWASAYIEHLAGRGLVEGYGGSYRPADPVTRAEFAKLVTGLFQASPLPGQPSPGWGDVADGAWYYEYARLAGESLLMLGDDDGRFHPERPLTRQEAAVVLARGLAQSRPGRSTLDSSPGGAGPRYSDWQEVVPWAQAAVEFTTQLGIFEGDDHERFRPQAWLTRAEAAATLSRTLAGQLSAD